MKGKAAVNAWPILMSVETATLYVGLGRDKIYELLNSGEVTKHKDGARTLIRRDDLDAWVDRRFPSSRQSGLPTTEPASGAPRNNPHGDMRA